MTELEKIGKELTEITEKHKIDFEVEINRDKKTKKLYDVTELIDKYASKLKYELSNVNSINIEYSERIIIEESIRYHLIDFQKFALAFLLH
jgi:hypothetical protein